MNQGFIKIVSQTRFMNQENQLTQPLKSKF